MLKRVPTVRTKFSKLEFVKAAIQAWQKIYNVNPRKENIGILFAQWSLETGQGGDCWNFNIGNVKAVDSKNEIIEYCVLKNVWEIVDGKKIFLSPEDPGSWFRSFNTLEDGMEFHFKFLRNKRYAKAWQAVEEGLLIQFCKLLKSAGYYTASEEHYRKALLYYFNAYLNDSLFEFAMSELNPIKVVKEDIPVNIEKPLNIEIINPDITFLRPERVEEIEKDPIQLSFWNKMVNFFNKIFKG